MENYCSQLVFASHTHNNLSTRSYYHFFVEGELEELCAAVDGVRIADRGFDHQNWFVILEKTLPDGTVIEPSLVPFPSPAHDETSTADGGDCPAEAAAE